MSSGRHLLVATATFLRAKVNLSKDHMQVQNVIETYLSLPILDTGFLKSGSNCHASMAHRIVPFNSQVLCIHVEKGFLPYDRGSRFGRRHAQSVTPRPNLLTARRPGRFLPTATTVGFRESPTLQFNSSCAGRGNHHFDFSFTRRPALFTCH